MELFKLFGSVLIDDKDAINALKNTNKEGQNTGDRLKKMGGMAVKAGALVGTAAIAGGVALFGMATKAAGATDRIDKLSQKIGISREGFQEWEYVLSQNGMEIETLQTGMKTLVGSIDQAIEGTGAGADSFKKLGISVTDSTGKVKSQEEMFNETVIALQGMEDGTEKAKLANDLFGRSGSEMMPLLNGAAGSVEDLKNKAHELGIVMGDDAIDAGVVLTDTMDSAKRAFGGVATEVGVAVMPMIQKLLEWVVANMPQIKEIFSNVFDRIKTVVETVIDVFQTYLLPVIQTVWQWIQDNMPAIQETMVTIFEAIKQIWKDTLKPVFMAIWDLVKVLWEVFKVVWPHIQAIMKIAFEAIKTIWNSVLKPVFDLVVTLIKRIADKFTEYMPIIEKVWEVMSATLKWAYDNIIKPTIENIGKTIDTIKGFIDKALGWFDTFKDGIKDKIEWARDKVKEAIDKIKGFFDFKFKWPELKMPKFSIQGSMNPLKWLEQGVPRLKVNWNADGAIFDKPTIFNTPYGMQGVGEAGPEAVAPISKLQEYIRDAVGDAQGGNNDTILKEILRALKEMKIVMDTGELVGVVQGEMDFRTGQKLGGVGFV